VLGLLRPPRRARNAGALVALFALMVQNFADFGLELPGILLPFVVCLGVETVRLQMWAERWTGRSLDVPITRRPCLWGGLVLTIAAVLGVGAGVWHVHRHGLRVDDARIRSIGMEAALDDAFERELEAAMKRHPADYHLPQLGGIRAYHTGRDEPLPLLARSLYLYPGAAVSHLYVARTLARSGRIDQALVEYMETARRRPSLVPSVADEVVEICGGFAAARHWARLPADHALVYEALAEAYLRADMPEEARRADVAALSVDPRAAGPLRRSVRRHMKAGMWKDALELARRLTRVEDQRASGLALQAEIARATGEPEAALRLYERALAAEPRRRDIHLAMARIHFAREDTDALFDALDRYRATAPDERSRGRAIIVKAEYYRKLGLDNQAMAAYLEASSSLPDEARIWKAIAGIYEKQGDPVAALGAYRELARIEPEDPRWRKRVEEIVMEAKTRAISP
jgi:tetratricopeptide (TPR) repeat protein